MENKRLTEYREDLKRYEYKEDEKGYCWISEGQIVQKLGKLEDLEEQLGCSLDVAFKALKDGIHIEEVKFPYISFEKYVVRGIGLNGLDVISNICSFGECDFTCYYKDYKKTWWLKEDRSE